MYLCGQWVRRCWIDYKIAFYYFPKACRMHVDTQIFERRSILEMENISNLFLKMGVCMEEDIRLLVIQELTSHTSTNFNNSLKRNKFLKNDIFHERSVIHKIHMTKWIHTLHYVKARKRDKMLDAFKKITKTFLL